MKDKINTAWENLIEEEIKDAVACTPSEINDFILILKNEIRDVLNMTCETNEDIIFVNKLLADRGIKNI